MSTVALLAAWALGFPWVRASRIARAHLPLEIAFALPFGLGSTAALFYLCLWAGLKPLPAALAADAAVLLAGLAAWKLAGNAPEDAPPQPAFRLHWAALGAFCVAMLLFAAGLYTTSVNNPQGNWDAWAIWNLRARFLAGAGSWQAASSTDLGLSHPEYPTLWSSAVARAWSYAGSTFSPSAPIGAATLAALGLPVLLALALGAATTPVLGWFAGLLLLMTTGLWRQAGGQYADVPLGLFLLASLSAAFLAQKKNWSGPALALAGAFASFAAFTKNEGQLGLVLLAATLAVVARARIVFFLAGAAPVALLAAAYRLLLAPPVKVFAPELISGPRVRELVPALLLRIWELGQFPAHPLLLAAVMIALLGLRPLRERLWPLALPGLLLLGDLVVLLGTPNDLVWQIETALDRLLVQLMPALLFAFCLWPKAPASAPEPASPKDQPSAPPRLRKPR